MSGMKEIPYEISPCFEVIHWQGEKGEVDDLGRIAFPPRSVKQKFYGCKVSFVFRGKGYGLPTGSEIKKGYVIALPIEALDDVKITSVTITDVFFGSDIETIRIVIKADYEKEYRGKTIGGRVIHRKSVPIKSAVGRPLKEVVAEFFSDVVNRMASGMTIDDIEYYLSNRLDKMDKRDGFIIHHHELVFDKETGIMKHTSESHECLSYAPIDVLFQRFDTLKVKMFIDYSVENSVIDKSDWKSSKLHKCLKDCVWIKPVEPVKSYHSFKFSLSEFHKLLETGKIQVTEIIIEKVHDDENNISFDEFLSDLKKYDLEETNEHIKYDKRRLEKIKFKHHYYVRMSKNEIAEMLQKITGVSLAEKIFVSFVSDEYRSEEEQEKDYREMQKNIKEILEKIDKDAWVKVLSVDGDWSGMYVESTEELSIIIPGKQEIVIHYKRYTDGYEEESGEYIYYTTNETKITEAELEKQEKERESEMQRLNMEIKELEEKKNLLEKKSPRDLYRNIVEFFFPLNDKQ